MNREEFCKIQKALGLNNREIAEALGLSLKEIECYRTRPESPHNRKIPATVAIAITFLLEIQNLKLAHKRQITSIYNRRHREKVFGPINKFARYEEVLRWRCQENLSIIEISKRHGTTKQNISDKLLRFESMVEFRK